jgi:hypothetical protein
MLAVIINPETWFFGEKFSGYLAITIHLVIGVLGVLIGYLIYKKNKFAYFGGIFLFAVVLSGILVNHFSCVTFDLKLVYRFNIISCETSFSAGHRLTKTEDAPA